MTKDELRQLRERLGLTQPAMAMRCGIPIDTYRKYEQGAISPGKRAASILEALDASTAQRERVPA